MKGRTLGRVRGVGVGVGGGEHSHNLYVTTSVLATMHDDGVGGLFVGGGGGTRGGDAIGGGATIWRRIGQGTQQSIVAASRSSAHPYTRQVQGRAVVFVACIEVGT
jgi:hypothetical protein